jgi:hypothetical protein
VPLVLAPVVVAPFEVLAEPLEAPWPAPDMIACMSHAPERGAGLVALGASLLVCRQVEGDEEHEVGAENEETGESGKLLTSAGTVVGHPGEVGRGKVCV